MYNAFVSASAMSYKKNSDSAWGIHIPLGFGVWEKKTTNNYNNTPLLFAIESLPKFLYIESSC